VFLPQIIGLIIGCGINYIFTDLIGKLVHK